ncbi:uncharacterized protein [Nicotiana tomentosiformis]|uniref:uncharacterized protein n=1 Tax=Nicotiana tomentosiformis TaxID=4098 RepID=UPI00388C39B4
MKNTPWKIVTILDELSENENQWPSKSAERRRSTGVHQVDVNTSVAPGTLPVATERNPKETVNDVILRSGQVLKDPALIQNDVKLEKESGEQLKNDVDIKNKGLMKSKKKKKEEKSRREEPEESHHMPTLPISQKLYREKLDKQFERFLDMLKQEIGEGDWRVKVCTNIVVAGRPNNINTRGDSERCVSSGG